jgi:hypothetical protein
MTSNYSGNPGESLELGGLFSRMQVARIEYSTFKGSISWEGSVTGTAFSVMAASFAAVNDYSLTGTSVILDSYGMASFSNKPVSCNNVASSFWAGGLVGLAASTDVVRSYSSTTLQSVGQCATPLWGGLAARAVNSGNVVSYGSFWNSSNGPTIAVAFNNTPALAKYTAALPVAVPVSASLLADISTFVTREGATAGFPGGDGLATTNETTTTVTEQDHRWAIETGNVQAFVFPNYTSATNYWTREHIADTTVAASMNGRGMVLEGPVTAYPNLGRVWEICSAENNGFPVLVWEERNCSGSGGGGSGGGGSGGGGSGGVGSDAGSGSVTAAPGSGAVGSRPGSGSGSGSTASGNPELANTGVSETIALRILPLVAALLIVLGAFLLASRRKLS